MFEDHILRHIPWSADEAEKIRSFLNRACDRYADLADQNFPRHLASDNPHRFWQGISEALVAHECLEVGLALLPTQDAPDIFIRQNDRNIWLEVICPEPRGVPEGWTTPVLDGTTVTHMPHNALLLRWTAAIKEKAEKLLGKERERTLPVAISAQPEEWSDAIAALLPYEEHRAWLASFGGEAHVMEKLFQHYARDGCTVRTDFYPVKQAMLAITHPTTMMPSVIANLEGEARAAMTIAANSYLNQPPSDAVRRLAELLQPAYERNFGTGVSIVHESERRPIVALFSREDTTSLMLAGLLHLMFKRRRRGREANPVLYCADRECSSPPTLLALWSEQVIFVPGMRGSDWAEWRNIALGKTVMAHVTEAGITAAGRRFAIDPVVVA